MNKEWFIQRYSDIHSDLDKLEGEIDAYLKNKKDILTEDKKLEELKIRTIETIDLLNKTREDERRIFNY
jgi:t-SNARE complex subunit (syntaxin)